MKANAFVPSNDFYPCHLLSSNAGACLTGLPVRLHSDGIAQAWPTIISGYMYYVCITYVLCMNYVYVYVLITAVKCFSELDFTYSCPETKWEANGSGTVEEHSTPILRSRVQIRPLWCSREKIAKSVHLGGRGGGS